MAASIRSFAAALLAALTMAACGGRSDPAGACAGVAAGTVCRAAAGPCDVAEACDGVSADCPVDALATAATTCRASAGPCDVAETCSGSSPECPADVLVAGGTTCREAAGGCDVAEACTGTEAACPADAYQAASTVCREAAGPCDVAETCTGADAACPADVLAPATTVCRASNGPCDVAESCTGATVDCPADAYQAARTVCRASNGPCDVAESCDGTAAVCPADAFAPAGTLCGAPDLATCTRAPACDGSAIACPPPVGTNGTPANGCCTTIAAVTDGGFEAGSPWAAWAQSSTQVGTPICNTSNCNSTAPRGPRSGNNWCWFGGTSGLEDGSASQSVAVPITDADLRPELVFWLKQSSCSNVATDYMEARFNGNALFGVTSVGAACGVNAYVEKRIDLGAFAGTTGVVQFFSHVNAAASDPSFEVDDVELKACLH